MKKEQTGGMKGEDRLLPSFSALVLNDINLFS